MVVLLVSESLWDLLRSAAHWEFELLLMVVFDGIILGLCWPFLRKHWLHHVARDLQAVQNPNTWTWTDPYRYTVYYGPRFGEVVPDDPARFRWDGPITAGKNTTTFRAEDEKPEKKL